MGGGELFGIVVTLVIVVISLLFTAVITIVSMAVPAFIFYRLMKANADNQRLLKDGQPAVGQILSAQQTGAFINYNPQVRLTVDVQPLVGEPYQASVTTVVPMIALPRVQPGQTVDVRYDAEDHSRIAIVGL